VTTGGSDHEPHDEHVDEDRETQAEAHYLRDHVGLVLRRRVIRADESLRAYEHRYTMRAQTVVAAAIAHDLGVRPDSLEPRMAATATVTVLEVLGEHYRDVTPADAREAQALRAEALARVDRALVFIGGGIGALQDATRRR
jgi:hypothetical protein